jgi:hypothetical protein
MKGPSIKEQWVKWKNATSEQKARSATINELERLIKSFDVRRLLLKSFDRSLLIIIAYCRN